MPKTNKLRKHATGQWVSTFNGKDCYFGENFSEALVRFKAKMAETGRPVAQPGPAGTVAEIVAAWEEATPGYAWGHRMGKAFAAACGREEIHPKTKTLPKDILHRYAGKLALQKRFTGTENERSLSAGTICHKVKTARTILLWAEENEMLLGAPRLPKRLPKANLEPKDIRIDDVARIFDEINSGDRRERAGLALRFMLEVGARVQEVCNLRWEHIDFRTNVCVLTEHKTADSTGKPRRIMLTPKALELLEGIDREECGYVFTNRSRRPFKPSGLRSPFYRARRKLGINFGSPRFLRPTAAMDWLEQDTPLDVVQRLLGHSSIRTTQRYAQAREVRTRAVASTLASPLRSHTPAGRPKPRRKASKKTVRRAPRLRIVKARSA